MYACVVLSTYAVIYNYYFFYIRIQVNFLASDTYLRRFVMFWGPTALSNMGETVNVLKLIKDMLAQWESLLLFCTGFIYLTFQGGAS